MTKRQIEEDEASNCVCKYNVSDDPQGSLCDYAQYYLFDWDNNILNMPTKVIYFIFDDSVAIQFDVLTARADLLREEK